MGFSSFNLFSDNFGDYTDFSNLKSVEQGALDSVLGSKIPGDNIFGLVPGASLSSLRKRKFTDYGFILDTVTNEKLAFQYNVIPREAGGANYAEQMTLGRSVPRMHYSGGKARTVELPITFTMRERTREDVLRSARWLESLAYPDYSSEDEISQGPHPVVLVQGKLYTNDTWLVRDFSITWGSALDPVTQIPESVTVNLTLVEVSLLGKSKGDFLVL